MTMLETPVAFIIFNRPDHTARVFAEIARAQPKKLLVIADGPRNADESLVCAQTRAQIKVDWDCELLTNYSETNLGCRGRVSSGIDWIFTQVDEAIILEDDCIPHPTFFAYCEKMLAKYRDDSRVMMISGSNFAQTSLDIPESYVFSRYANIWGWATWRRAWSLYDVDMKRWPEYRQQGQLRGLLLEPRVLAYYQEVWDQILSINTWDFQWSFCCLFNDGLCVVPRANLITNVGVFGAHFDGGRTNIDLPTTAFDLDNIVDPASVFPDQRYDGPLFSTNEVFVRHKEPSAATRFLRNPGGSIVRYVKLGLYPVFRLIRRSPTK
jgi:hypothetical protein